MRKVKKLMLSAIKKKVIILLRDKLREFIIIILITQL